MSLITKCINLSTKLPNRVAVNSTVLFDQNRNYAARKGTREKARKRKVKVEVQKVGFIPHNQRGLDKIVRPIKKFDDSWKAIATDDVYPAKYYRWRVYSFEEAVQCHRETHHPTMYNVPDAPLQVIVELNMQGEKITRFVDSFHRMAPMPYKFDHGEERNILAFSKDQSTLVAALKAGAAVAGGQEIIKDIQSGKLALQDFQYVVAHPNILPELVCLRGLMKKKFPNPKNGTLSVNLVESVEKFLNGINYSAIRDEYEKDFGIVETKIGTLDMELNHLEANFESLISDINCMKPKRSGHFISRALLISPPSSENLKVEHKHIINEEDGINEDVDEDEDNEEEGRKEASI